MPGEIQRSCYETLTPSLNGTAVSRQNTDLQDGILTQFPSHDVIPSKIITDYSSLLTLALLKAYDRYTSARDKRVESKVERGGEPLMQILRADEAEKRRIAREPHDGIAQALTTAIFSLDMLAANLPSDPSQTVEALRM